MDTRSVRRAGGFVLTAQCLATAPSGSSALRTEVRLPQSTSAVSECRVTRPESPQLSDTVPNVPNTGGNSDELVLLDQRRTRASINHQRIRRPLDCPQP